MKKKLLWDAWNRDHIKKHNIRKAEIEDIYQNPVYKRKTYGNRIMFFGRTEQGRLVTVVCSQEKQNDYYVVSARDMSKKEREILYKYENVPTKTD